MSFISNISEKVRSAPRVLFIWEQENTIYVGQNIELLCAVLTKDPKTKYRWFFKRGLNSDNLGSLIDLSRYQQPPFGNPKSGNLADVRFTLQLKNLTERDSGFYSCQAENRVGNGSDQANLTVTKAPLQTGINYRFSHFLRDCVVLIIPSLKNIFLPGQTSQRKTKLSTPSSYF